jgi:LEA14-like dessication related protein
MAAPDPRHPRTRAAALAVALVLFELLGGCTALVPHFEKPQLSVVGVELRDASLAEQHFRVRMRVENPNDRALPVRGIDYTLKLAGEDFGSGSSVSAFTVPARGETEFELQLTTNLATTLLKVLPRLKDASQPLEYRLAGKIRTDLAFVPTVSFDERGSLPVR